MSAAALLPKLAQLCAACSLPAEDPGRANITHLWDAARREWWGAAVASGVEASACWPKYIRGLVPHAQLDQVLSVVFAGPSATIAANADHHRRLDRAAVALALPGPKWLFLHLGSVVPGSTQSLKAISSMRFTRSGPRASPETILEAIDTTMMERHGDDAAMPPEQTVRDVTKAGKKVVAQAAAAAAAASESEPEPEPESPRAASPKPEEPPSFLSHAPIPAPLAYSPVSPAPSPLMPEAEAELAGLAAELSGLGVVDEEEDEEYKYEDEEEEEEEYEDEEKDEETSDQTLTARWVRLCLEMADLPRPAWARGTMAMSFIQATGMANHLISRMAELGELQPYLAREGEEHQHQQHQQKQQYC
ncbi:hypothetical protein LY76DRAFT_650925 [Colletotrichum caudatum]|nr:hypothetical protein LY76DRAFT_650925 [Colletotrichum caudatum]